MKRLSMVSLLACFILAGMFGWSSPALASTEIIAETEAFTPSPNNGMVFLYRNQPKRLPIETPITLDGQLLGETGPRTYMVLELSPGRHRLKAKTGGESVLNLDVEAGQIYFVWQSIRANFFYASTRLQLVDEAVGRAGVLESKLLENTATIAASRRMAELKAARDRLKIKPNEIVKLPFVAGVSTFTVEAIAKRHGCWGGIGAGRITAKGPIEVYRMNCDSGQVFLARCEFRQCKALR